MERMLVTAADYFRRENIRNVIVGQGQDHSYEEQLREAGYEVRIADSIAGSFAGARSFRRMVRQLDADVVHIHTEGNYLRTALVARFALGLRGGLVRTVHNVFDARGKWRVTRLLQALAGDRAVNVVIAPSLEVAINERNNLRRARVVMNWVDDDFYRVQEERRQVHGGSDGVPVAVIVGNCSAIKHHELALTALRRTNHRLIHIGDESGASGEERSLLEFMEKEGRLIERGVHSPRSALLKADYFMMSSRHEGMPVALAEAIVAGVPAFVSDAPGLRWARDVDGVVLVPADEDAWLRVVREWRSGGARSVTSRLDLSAARGAREYSEIYRKLAGRKRRRMSFAIRGR